MPHKSAIQSYRRRVRGSACRKYRSEPVCNKTKGCKYTVGTLRKYCRKSSNIRRQTFVTADGSSRSRRRSRRRR